MTPTATILLLGSGELGREFVISAKRLGCRVIACDSYEGAPAMQVADGFEVFSMLDGDALRATIEKHRPDHIVPEVEAIRTEILAEVEAEGFHVVPSARAAQLTMNRDAIRDLAASELGLRTSTFEYATTREELAAAAGRIGFPLVVKPVMSSSGKGQSTVKDAAGIDAAWDYAAAGMRGDRLRVIAEAFIDFDYEITLLTVRHKDGVTFCPPIGHRQERGDYRESWQPAAMSDAALAAAQDMATKVVDALGGHGIFGVEYFVKGDEVIFSELSPRPHDTGMVTLISQSLSEFDLHARAILGLPIPAITVADASASAVLLADRDAADFAITGLADALTPPNTATAIDARIFGKPVTRPYRRMGVALAKVAGGTTDEARAAAVAAASKLIIEYR
ncbi:MULTISPECIES: formate-dependent phosphoribosylglycinamide formyltransferase [unclassified Sphingopyxis]|jgi:phosphoribosylglycinamide formyltransferase 2|uniref:formate-dependent phosphoribosylglycinamide formyltransferase n=1 Tax=unclassified Sphingopyxis TaxID=2614943 RepID=UPI0006C60A17|nr:MULTISPECIES: formate-dependent phosphoribosylglycinamide formyltransferase [unclassified Sphingopyxis]USI77944.1 formate-dependent phosphoribosylglycinamide formyltransferase [Sphingopyxis sp. USTB-05]GAO79689.1 phosphoribosylglycinamide formyltransferase 2 [Sphingopyxis sp. C-1]